jgi:hypothetical protein
MKWNSFEKKYPEIGTNILYLTESNDIGVCEWTKEMYRYIHCNRPDHFLVDFYNDVEANELDLSCAKYWIYPSQIEK